MINTNKNRENIFIISSVLSIILSISLGVIFLKTNVKDFFHKTNGSANIPIYIIIFLTFFILFFLLHKSLSAIFKQKPLYFKNIKVSFATALTSNIILILLLILSFTNEDKIFAQEASFVFWHNINLTVLLIIVFLSNATFLLCAIKKDNLLNSKNSFNEKTSFYLLAVTIAFITSYAMYYYNIFNGDIYHCHAYFASIYNTFHGAPFNEYIAGIYGHYGLIFLPFLKLAQLLGINNIYKCFVLMVSGLSALSFLLGAYAIKVFVKNQMLRFLGMLAMPVVLVSMQAGVAYQRDPHRSFLVCVLMFLVAYAVSNYEKREKQVLILGFVTCILGIIWNTELGMFLSISWASFLCCIELQKTISKKYFKIILHLFSILVCFFIAFGIVNIYNYIVDKNFVSLKVFIIPFFSQSFQIKKLEAFLTTQITPWMFIVGVFLFFFAKGISSTKIFKKDAETDYYSAAYLSMSVMGLSTLTYAINRTAYFNFGLIYPLIILMICIMTQFCLPAIISLLNKDTSKHSMISAGFGITSMCVLFSLSLAFLSNIGYTSMIRQSYKSNESVEELNKFIGDVFATIDEDTVGIGMGTVELYAMVGKDTKAYLTDYSDFTVTQQSVDYAETVLRNLSDKPVLITNSSLDMHKTYGNGAYEDFIKTHEYVGTWRYPRDVVFMYFVPIES